MSSALTEEITQEIEMTTQEDVVTALRDEITGELKEETEDEIKANANKLAKTIMNPTSTDTGEDTTEADVRTNGATEGIGKMGKEGINGGDPAAAVEEPPSEPPTDPDESPKSGPLKKLGKGAMMVGKGVLSILKVGIPIVSSFIVPLYMLQNNADAKKAREYCVTYCVPQKDAQTLTAMKAWAKKNGSKGDKFMQGMWDINKEDSSWDWQEQPFCYLKPATGTPPPPSPGTLNQWSIQVTDCANAAFTTLPKKNRCTPCCIQTCNRMYVPTNQQLVDDFWDAIADGLGISKQTLQWIVIGIAVLIGCIIVKEIISAFSRRD